MFKQMFIPNNFFVHTLLEDHHAHDSQIIASIIAVWREPHSPYCNHSSFDVRDTRNQQLIKVDAASFN